MLKVLTKDLMIGRSSTLNLTEYSKRGKKMTQKEMVLKHLKRFGTIQPMEAQQDYSICRLAAVINDLRKEGHLINTITVPHTNKFGHKTHYAKYHLVHVKDESVDYASEYEKATSGY